MDRNRDRDRNIMSMYNEIIMEHSRSKRNKRFLPQYDLSEKGHNPNCGDEINIQIKFDGDIIEEIAFTGSGCAISQASTSIMCDVMRGKTIDEAIEIAEVFIGMIRREYYEDSPELDVLDDAIIFQNISNMPARVKCAVLAWRTLRESIA